MTDLTAMQDYIKPELLVLIAVLYIVGLMIKGTEKINDKHIPLILGISGIALSLIYVLGTEGLSVMGIFTAITQGILTAGTSVYINQLIKQSGK